MPSRAGIELVREPARSRRRSSRGHARGTAWLRRRRSAARCCAARARRSSPSGSSPTPSATCCRRRRTGSARRGSGPSPSTTDVARILAHPRRAEEMPAAVAARGATWICVAPAASSDSRPVPRASAAAARSRPSTGRRASAPARPCRSRRSGLSSDAVASSGQVLREDAPERRSAHPFADGRVEALAPEVRLAPRVVRDRRQRPVRRRERPLGAAPEAAAGRPSRRTGRE